MRRAKRGLGVTAVLFVVAACATASPPIPMTGETPAIQTLAGRWTGRYESRVTGRFGSISFELRAGSDTARGDVQMIPAGRSEPLHSLERDRNGTWVDATRSPHFLTIRFVGVSDGRIRGCLDPYRDPDTGAVLLTSFRGVVSGDSIVGTFESSTETSGVRATGRWWVTRRPGGDPPSGSASPSGRPSGPATRSTAPSRAGSPQWSCAASRGSSPASRSGTSPGRAGSRSSP